MSHGKPSGQSGQRGQEETLFGGFPLADTPKLGVVRARFEGREEMSFEELLSGCSSLRVLTYSNSLSIIGRAASLVEDMEIVFGREDIVGEAEKLYWHQYELIRAVRAEMNAEDPVRGKVRSGRLRMFVVKDIVSHEKLFLMEGEGMRRILTGSANFSERAFSGKQNEGYLLFEDDPAAWEYYEAKYEKIKAASALAVPRTALLSDEPDVEDLPAFSNEGGAGIVAVEDGSPENGIVHKVVSSKTPKHFAGLSAAVPKSKGAARLDRKVRTEAIQYIKSNRRTEESNPEEYLSIDSAAGTADLSGVRLDLEVPEEDVARDVDAWVRYFGGFSVFRGESGKLARDYFAFWSWLWFGPLLWCDARNAVQARGEDVHDFPIFGILYGKSNCGKSELVDTLLRSMFGKSGATPTEWFTRNRVANLMAENRRYPLVFDDLERKRYSDYAVSLIKDDHIRLPEYPPVVLSMNAAQDTFETEVRKRCFVVYTGASLADDDPEAKELGKSVKSIKRELGTALYREYLDRVMAKLREEIHPDFLALSSGVLRDLILEHHRGDPPEWCHICTMDEHRRGRHDKVREDLRQSRTFDGDSWERRGDRWVLKMPDHNAANRLRRDVPDYVLSAGNVGNLVVFDAGEIEAFLGKGAFPHRWGLKKLLRTGGGG
jgi:hypothetical protein